MWYGVTVTIWDLPNPFWLNWSVRSHPSEATWLQPESCLILSGWIGLLGVVQVEQLGYSMKAAWSFLVELVCWESSKWNRVVTAWKLPNPFWLNWSAGSPPNGTAWVQPESCLVHSGWIGLLGVLLSGTAWLQPESCLIAFGWISLLGVTQMEQLGYSLVHSGWIGLLEVTHVEQLSYSLKAAWSLWVELVCWESPKWSSLVTAWKLPDLFWLNWSIRSHPSKTAWLQPESCLIFFLSGTA